MATKRQIFSAIRCVGVALCVLATAAACSRSSDEQGNVAVIELTSSSFADGVIPKKYASCDGNGVSPALSWTVPPTGTQSYVLIMDDMDSPHAFLRGRFVHWVLYGLAADKRELPEALPPQEQLPDGTHQGKNGVPMVGYVGPCPDDASAHRYVFTLYALDVKPDLPAGASARDLRKAMQGHVIGKGELMARYRRSAAVS
ncbi:MAG: YbhB/YbcL family Raf kinase inhibitor-like protein [Steroidobacterales bacterium]